MAKYNSKVAKRYIKFLPLAQNSLFSKAIQTAPDCVIKGICNCAANVANGDVKLTPKQRKLLSLHKTTISKLLSPIPIAQKRKLLQRGGNLSKSLIQLALRSLCSSSITG